ncbi:unnamed protein product [Lota lota]
MSNTPDAEGPQGHGWDKTAAGSDDTRHPTSSREIQLRMDFMAAVQRREHNVIITDLYLRVLARGIQSKQNEAWRFATTAVQRPISSQRGQTERESR